MTVTYRDATPADAPTLDRLFDSIFVDTFAHLYRPEDLHDFLTGFGIDDWKAEISDPAYAFRIAEVEGEAAGFAKLGPFTLPVEPTGPAVMLDQLYVVREHHGAGIARALMDWTIEEARRRGAEELYLTVFIENHRARRFYDSYGFEDVGRYDFMVGSQADEDVVMRKSL